MLTQAEGQQYLINKAKIKQLETENDELIRAASLRELEPGVYTAGNIIVEVTPNVRFDAKLATELYPLGPNNENIELYVAQVDSTLAKKHLTPAQYQAAQRVYPNNRVEVKLS